MLIFRTGPDPARIRMIGKICHREAGVLPRRGDLLTRSEIAIAERSERRSQSPWDATGSASVARDPPRSAGTPSGTVRTPPAPSPCVLGKGGWCDRY